MLENLGNVDARFFVGCCVSGRCGSDKGSELAPLRGDSKLASQRVIGDDQGVSISGVGE
jgi:hypothetical protein